ncbi:MAG: MFS transporter [Limosilactobacillus sp.]
MTSINPKSPLYKTSLLSFSLLAQTIPLAAVANPSLMNTFSDESATQIQMLGTVPNFAAIICTFLSSFIAKKIGAKKTVMLGIILFLIGGVMPAICNSYSAILILRLIMGCGAGLFSPFTVSLIYQLYKGNDLNNMLGYQNSVQNVGSAVFAFVLGALVVNGWRAVYIAYVFAIVPLFLFGSFVKLPKHSQDERADNTAHTKITTNAKVIGFMFLTILTFIMFSVITVNLAGYVVNKHITTTSVASILIACISIASMVSSAMFGKIIKVLHSFVLTVTFLGIALGFILLFTAKSVGVLTAGVLIAGFFFGWYFPQVFMRLDQVSPKGAGNFSTSLVLIGVNVGVFLAPAVMNGIAGMFGQVSAEMVFKISACGFTILTIWALFNGFQLRKKQA